MQKIRIEDIKALNNLIPKQEGLRELKVISSDFATEKGIGVLVLHPDDFNEFKKLTPKPADKETNNSSD